jgi:hypothetical protein
LQRSPKFLGAFIAAVVKQQNTAAAMAAAALATPFQVMWALAREWAGMAV